MTTAKTKTTQHLSFALGGQSRGVFFIWSGGEIGKRSVWVATIGSTRSNRQTRCTGSNPVLTTKIYNYEIHTNFRYIRNRKAESH